MHRRQLEIGGNFRDIETAVSLDVEKGLLNFHRFPGKSAYRVFYSNRTFPTLQGLQAICLDLKPSGRKKRLSGMVVFEGLGLEVSVSRVAAVTARDGSSFINFDSAQDGSWQLVYTKDIVNNISSIRRIRIVREQLPEVDEETFRRACQKPPLGQDYVEALMELTISLDGDTLSVPFRLMGGLSPKGAPDAE